MTYISREEVKRILKRYAHLDMTLGAIDEEIEALPSHDPKSQIIELIEKKIDNYKKKRKEITKRSPLRLIGDDTCCISIRILEQLLSEINSLNN